MLHYLKVLRSYISFSVNGDISLRLHQAALVCSVMSQKQRHSEKNTLSLMLSFTMYDNAALPSEFLYSGRIFSDVRSVGVKRSPEIKKSVALN